MTRDSVRRRGARPSLAGLDWDGAKALLALLLVGLLLRAFIAGILLPQSGFRIDIGDFTAWAQRLVVTGPGGFYETGYFSDYPPGYMYVLWALGSLGAVLRPLVGSDITSGLVKAPGILADIGVAALLYALVRRFADDRVGPWSGRAALLAAGVYLFNPGTIFNSAVWGQVDSVGSLAMLAAIYVLASGLTEVAAVLAVVAVLIKFQTGLLIPIVVVVGIKRHLFGRSSDPALDGTRDPTRVLTSLAAGMAAMVVLILPFGMAIWAPGDPSHSLIGKLLEAAGTYNGLSINAFNLWRNPFGGVAGFQDWGNDQGTALAIGSLTLTWQTLGTILFLAVALFALWQLWRRDDLAGLLLATLTVSVAFFALPTRVHERYLFPALVLAAPLIARNRRWLVLYAALSVSFFLNVYWVYSADWSFAGQGVLNPGAGGGPMPRDPLLEAVFFSQPGLYLISFGIVVALGWILVQAAALAGERPRPVPDVSVALATDAAAAAPLAADDPPERAERAEGDAVTPPVQAPPRARWRRLSWLRADPHDPLFRDPGRHLDRLDAVLVAGFILFALLFRVWRLDIPRQMHFDEAYHARSAAEWLSDWEHGWTRDVYEWTHPMLAKYLIAAGIVVADPNKVVGRQELDAPAPAVAVAPRRSSIGHPRSVVFVGGNGPRIEALDALTGERLATWNAAAPVASLAYDEDGQRLLVGLATRGDVQAYELGRFLGLTGPRAPPAQLPAIASRLRTVSQIVVASGDSMLVLRGPDGISELERATGAHIASSRLVASAVGYLPAAGAAGSSGAQVAAVDPARRALVLLDAKNLKVLKDSAGTEIGVKALPAAPSGPLLVQGTGEEQQIFVPVGPLPKNDQHPAVPAGLSVFRGSTGQLTDTVPLPAPARALAWQSVANIVYVAGPDAVWTVEPHGDGPPASTGFALFDTTAVGGQPLAMGFDISDNAQGDDNAHLLVATQTPGGSQLVTVDAGSNAFAWRIAGVVFGSILVALIYLLAATMFRRRSIAILAATFVAVDGMSYVMSRIAMNDIFTATFIVGAYLLFWLIWSGRWARSAWWALPTIGVLIGLAAASKWVGFYALAGLWVLVMARSHLGRLLLVGGLTLGAIAIGIGGPWPSLVVAFVGLALALLLVYLRPVRLGSGDLLAISASGVVIGGVGLAFAIAYGTVAGRSPSNAVESAFAFLFRGLQASWPAWIAAAVTAVLLVARAVWSLRRPASDARWYVPGELGGFAVPWIWACLAVIPLAVYVATYIPYLQLGYSFAIPNTGPGYGWSLDELHSQMFGYHFGLVAGHPAASPWWSWPLDLKPVWFYGHNLDNRDVAVIYNGGNPLLFWAGIPALLFCAVMAWKRRSAALVLIGVAFAFQYLPWTRIERATFAYHYLTALLFAMVAVAYVVAEALHRPFWRDFGIAFLAAAAVAGLLVFPLGSALPMPDWYINAARALPPWNYNFQFPNPPSGARAPLVNGSGLLLAIGLVGALMAAAWAIFGRPLLERWRGNRRAVVVAHGAAPAPVDGHGGQAPSPGAAPPRADPDADHDPDAEDPAAS